MKCKNIAFFIFITLLALAALACNFGKGTPLTEPPQPAQMTTPVKTEEPAVVVPGAKLGAEGRSAEGGFTYRELPGYSIESDFGIVTMLAPDADPDLGPVISMVGGLNEPPLTAEEQLATLTESGEITTSKPRPISINGVSGLEVETAQSDGALVGRIVVLMITEYRQFIIMAGAPVYRWESELLPLYEAELAEITFFKPEVTAMPTEPAVSQVEEEIRQWASSAIASSEYGRSDWSAAQAAGAPDTTTCGDQSTAWAAADSNTVEWIELTYVAPVTPKQVNIHISNNPTFITKVELFDIYGDYHQVYEFKARSYPECPYIFSIDITEEGFQAVGVKITIDQTNAPGWVEIDAVELVGMGDPSLLNNPAQPEPGASGAVFPTPDGFAWRAGGPSGFEDGQYPGLYGMDVSDSTGLLYVTDSIRSVRIFDLEGNPLFLSLNIWG